MSTAPWGAESLHLLPGVGAARFSHNGEPSAPTPGRLGATDSGKGPHYSSTPPAPKSTRSSLLREVHAAEQIGTTSQAHGQHHHPYPSSHHFPSPVQPIACWDAPTHRNAAPGYLLPGLRIKLCGRLIVMRARNSIMLGAMRALQETRTARLAAALAGLLLLAGGLNHAASQQPPPPTASETLRVDVRVVNVYCTVKTKKGALITDLGTSDFEIREDGKKQELRYFVRETDRPLTLALLLDTSISKKAVLPIEKETAAQFFRQVLRPVDLALLMSFDVNVDLLHDFTSDVEQLQESLQHARINSPVDLGPFPRTRTAGTRLYDAIYLASREKLGSEVGRKAIILVTDGFDAGSSKKEKEALEAAHRGEIILYAIGLADPHFYRSRGGTLIGASVLKKLARETGGLAVFPRNPEQLRRAFEQIATELRSQYILGYTPTNRAHDGRFRKIEVKVKRKGLKVQARRGYYAPTR